MSLDPQFQKQRDRYLQQLQSKYSQSQVIRNLVESPNCQAWKILEIVLEHIQKNRRNKYDDALQTIERSIRQVSSFSMLIYIYSLKVKSKSQLFLYSTSWRFRYNLICIQNGDILIFSTWLTAQPHAKIVQQTLCLVCQYFPKMFYKQHLDMTQIQMNAIIQWVVYFQTPTPEQYFSVLELAKIVKESSIKLENDYTLKQHLVLKKIIEASGSHAKLTSPNIFVFIYPFVLTQREITYFIHLHYDFLLDLSEENITNFFISITKSAMSQEILYLINKISNLLKAEEEYFKLRFIYEKFILPIFIKRAKTCFKIQKEVYELCQLYILGFLKHCNLNQEGISCIIRNVNKIKNKQVQQKWLGLCAIIISRYPQFKNYIEQQLKQMYGKPVILQEPEKISLDSDAIWQITGRSSRKHKKYVKVPSKFKGIQNSSNQCYIISTVQALHKIQLLQQLFDTYRPQIKSRLKLLDEIRILFQELSGVKATSKVEITYLKSKGPSYFADSFQQEDVQQYILELFEEMQKQMKKAPGLLQKFKEIFESTIKITIRCKKCNQELEKQEKSYTFTISNLEVLSEKTQEKVPGYICEKCSSKDTCRIIRTIVLASKILIVHINRFSHEKGITKKQLSTQTILREFMDYQLQGIICHVGKNVENGHYLYYNKVGAQRWAQFNDMEVEQFDLESPSEEFQRELKAETTPYILFYKKKG